MQVSGSPGEAGIYLAGEPLTSVPLAPSGRCTRNPEIPMTWAAKINLPAFSLKLNVPFSDTFLEGTSYYTVKSQI